MVMKFFRKKKNVKIILGITAILIIPGFLIWGVGLSRPDKSKYIAAVVNREAISLRELSIRANEEAERYREILGDKYDELIKNMNLEKIVLHSLIQEKILFQQARKRHIKVSNNEIIEVVKSSPVFKDEKGNFSQEKYNQVINNLPPEKLKNIEEDTRRAIIFQKLETQVVPEGSITVTDDEVSEYIKNNKDAEKMDRELIRRRILRQKQSKSFNDWYKNVVKSSKITVYLGTSFQDSQEAQSPDVP